MIRAAAATSIVMVILAMIGLFTARELTPQVMDGIFFLSFFPAIAAGVAAYLGGRHAKNN